MGDIPEFLLKIYFALFQHAILVKNDSEVKAKFFGIHTGPMY